MIEIYIKHAAWRKIKMWVDIASGEVSGLGEVEVVDSKITVTEVYLLDQTSSGSSTEMDSGAVAKLIDDKIRKDGDANNIKLWWHSHADMNVFWSATDDNAIEEFNNETDTNNWFLSIVVNKKGEVKCRIDTFHPVQFFLNDIPLKIVDYTAAMYARAEKEVKRKVKKPKPYDYSKYKDKNKKKDKKKNKNKNKNKQQKWGPKYGDYNFPGADHSPYDYRREDDWIDELARKSEERSLEKIEEEEDIEEAAIKEAEKKKGVTEYEIISLKGERFKKRKDGILVKLKK